MMLLYGRCPNRARSREDGSHHPRFFCAAGTCCARACQPGLLSPNSEDSDSNRGVHSNCARVLCFTALWLPTAVSTAKANAKAKAKTNFIVLLLSTWLNTVSHILRCLAFHSTNC